MTRYFWDFFGPDAERTAQHFRRHLDEFLEKNACAGCATGTESGGAGHFAAFCTTPPEHDELVVRALRPRRRAE